VQRLRRRRRDRPQRRSGGRGRDRRITINLFWVIVVAANFLFFFAVLAKFAIGPIAGMLKARREKIEQGIQDAEAAHAARANAEAERQAAIGEARREAREIVDRAQKVAQETRDADIAATRDELERMRVRAAADIESERSPRDSVAPGRGRRPRARGGRPRRQRDDVGRPPAQARR